MIVVIPESPKHPRHSGKPRGVIRNLLSTDPISLS